MKKSRKENLKRRRRKTEKLIFAIGLTSIIFVVATYAWFIGTTQIYVNEFEIGVKSGDGLTLSLDGTSFTNDVTISEETITTGLVSTYATHTNHWVGEGLVPISSVGIVIVVMLGANGESSLAGSVITFLISPKMCNLPSLA